MKIQFYGNVSLKHKIIIMLHDVLLCFFTTCLTHGDLEMVLSSIIYISYLTLGRVLTRIEII